MKKSAAIRLTGAAGAVALGLMSLAGCSGGSGSGSSDSAPATVTFWGWAPGYADAVKAFNASHKDVVVKYQEVQPGSKGGYQKMLNAVTANNAPCLAQVGYETLPSFAAQGALEDVASYAKADEKDFQPAAWKSVSIGDAVYGAPVDTGPMGLFYNKELFDSLGLSAPATWDEYKADAEKIHASDPKKFISSPYLDYDYAGLAWQTGAKWFDVDGDSWKVTMASDANAKVADYWQGLVSEGLISSAPMYDQAWYTGLGDGSIATVVGAVWQAGVIKGGAADASGKWAVAPMPQWSAGDDQVGNAGGSATAVLKGCSNAKAAWEFAHWMSTDKDTYNTLVQKAGLYPAATGLSDLPALTEADPYFGGQKIFDVFADAAPHVNPDWTWGPVMTKTAADLDDGLGKAWAGQGTITDALKSAQDKTVAELKKQGLKVSE
ncbi:MULTISPECIES: extracellular solute-binding protein [Leifsonia]|uniref:Multiple sugar transport system substrate-binding protein n=2 Tax=Leifsonia TaxID=110932 RepID=A0A7W4UZV1_LEIAQ|nr:MULTISPECIES: extracellular solute-binding protein [Leifsonia]MBB2969345.1 multiple sugar transport system substrate-binding protein [Leifsonia aquatica]NYK09446.1 multiple sugar transport system substrate-binding protein [Leifsonia naganoensis]